MTQRINVFEKGMEAMSTLRPLGGYLKKSPLGSQLLDLVYFRVSQINGCAYCLDMHSKDLRALGETEQRLYMLAAWREASCYTDRERAALEWAEAVTLVTNGHVSDGVYQVAASQFSDTELVDLTMAVLAINCYNRINVAFRMPAGDYVVGMHG